MDAWPADPDTYVSAAQVAAKLGYVSMKTFHNARARGGFLHERGFPSPALPGRWRAREILRWEDWNAERAACPPPANDIGPASSPAPTIRISPAELRLREIRRAAGLDR